MTDQDIHVHDILIIGAGPCGLAIAARLRENTPSALFTDSEHQRYHWMRSSSKSRRTSKLIRTSRRSQTVPDRLLSGPTLPELIKTTGGEGPDIAVLDAFSDSWMGAWEKKFKDLKISHLRSPMFFHPDPRDRDGLLGFAYRDGEPDKGELREIKGVVGKGLSKYQRKKKVKNSGKAQAQETTYLDERERHDYYRPSQSLFSSYCTDIITRYSLSSLVQKSEVQHIAFDPLASLFTLTTSAGIKYAKIVVLATGATAKPALPPCNPFTTHPHGSVCHAFSPTGVLPPHVKTKLKGNRITNIAVIGGGLTSAQVSALAISSGVFKVYHFTRGPLKTKHFDVDLTWVGKYKNFHLASFWSADSDEERFEMIKTARNGGSVNPEYKSVLGDLVKKGKVVLCEYTSITEAEWDDVLKTWRIGTTPAREGLPRFDHVVYATGVDANMASVPMMKDIVSQRPVEMYGGMPALTHDLMWDADCPLFVTGRLAGLRLGPGAGNLEGARQGAERAAWKIGELLQKWGDSVVDPLEDMSNLGEQDESVKKARVGSMDSGYASRRESDVEVDMRRLGLGGANQFGVFGLDFQSGDSDTSHDSE